jgi:uncharacterized membrane protein YidH (DUF202 family)
MKIIKKLIPFGLMAMPFAAGAVSSINDLFDLTETIINKLAPLLIAVAVIILLIGIINYIRAGDDEEKRAAGKNEMIYSIIGLFVMVSVWGLVAILSGTFNLDNEIPDTVNDLLPNF